LRQNLNFWLFGNIFAISDAQSAHRGYAGRIRIYSRFENIIIVMLRESEVSSIPQHQRFIMRNAAYRNSR
jgi:hypothetical protein